MNELVSVYIITHNRVDLLRRCVLSVINQSYQNLEIIIIDDASNDDTKKYIKSINDTRIIYLRNESNQGACYSRNRAINVASGKFITGCDDDDYFEVNRVQVFIENTELLKKHSLLFTHNKWLNKDGISNPVIDRFTKNIVTPKDLLPFNMIGNQIFCETTLVKNVLFDTDLPAWQDLDCWYRLLKKNNGTAIKVNHKTYIQDVSHEYGRITTKRKEKILSAFDIFCKKNRLTKIEKIIVINHLFSYKCKRVFFVVSSLVLLFTSLFDRFSIMLVLRNFKMAFLKKRVP